MIKVALIGHGYWGEKLQHYLQNSQHFKIVEVCDSKTNMAKVWSKVEAVVVATPIETHFDIVKQALNNNKHVFCEKPLALTEKDCIHLKNIAKRKKLHLAVEYTQTFSKGLKIASQDKDIGDLEAIEMSVKHLGRFLDQDVYWLLASHCLSILDIFCRLDLLSFSRFDLVKTEKRTETGLILFCNKKLKGCLCMSLNYPGKVYEVGVYGSRGSIIYQATGEPSLRSILYKKTKKALSNKLIYQENTWSIDEKNNLKHSIDYFYRVIKGSEISNIDRAIRVTKVLEALEKTPNNKLLNIN